MSEGHLPHKGADLFYTVQGPDSGIPILMLHGWTCDQTDWVFQIPMLLPPGHQSGRRFRVIAPDLRGHGRSTVEASTTLFDMITLTEDSAAVARHLHVSSENPALVIGHSMGGALAQELAARHPDLVRGLVLVDPSYYMTPEFMRSLTERFEGDPTAARQTAANFLGDSYTPRTPPWLEMWHKLRTLGVEARVMVDTWARLAEYLGPSGAEYLADVKARTRAVPRLVVCARPDSTRIEEAVGLGGYDRVEVLEAGHWLHKVDPDGFNAILESWLGEWGYLSNVAAGT